MWDTPLNIPVEQIPENIDLRLTGSITLRHKQLFSTYQL